MAEEAGDSLCVVCQDAPREVRFYDCAHSHLCALCTLRLIGCAGKGLTCPTCKASVTRIEDWSGEQPSTARPEFIKGGTGGDTVMVFIRAHLEATMDTYVPLSAGKQSWHYSSAATHPRWRAPPGERGSPRGGGRRAGRVDPSWGAAAGGHRALETPEVFPQA